VTLEIRAWLSLLPALACDPAWLVHARETGIAVFTATSSVPIAGGGVRGQLRSGRLSAARLAAGPIVMVPWGYAPDCSPIAWTGSWRLPSTVAVYAGRLRPRDRWIDHSPTIDVYMAWRQPIWQANDPRWRVTTTDSLLTPDEFLELFAALPTFDDLAKTPGPAIDRINRWAARHPTITRREPARTILAHLRGSIGPPT
jgi:hypothetical protein